MRKNFTHIFKMLVIVLTFQFSNFLTLSLNAENITDIYDNQPSITNCSAGTIKQSIKDKILKYVNDIRAIHKLAPVTYETAGDVNAQEAALICTANGNITHTPPSSSACYTSNGRKGAEESNLYIYYFQGGGGILPNSEESIDAWMIDDNTPSLGHRLSIINPFLTKLAFGRVDGKPKAGSMQSWDVTSMTMNYQTYVNGTTTVDYVACPQNNYPINLFKKDWLMSFSAIADKNFWGGNFQSVNFSNATIKVSNGNTNLQISDVSFNNNGNGSMGNCLIWKAGGLQDEVEYDVTISNVFVNGQSKNFTYKFKLTNQAAALPTKPLLATPSNNATKVNEDVTFEWNKVTGNQVTYDFQVASEDLTFENKVENYNSNTFFVQGLPSGKKFNWKVRAINEVGVGEWSETFTFTTAKGMPSRASLLTPLELSTVPYENINFTWEFDENAEKYEFQVSNEKIFIAQTMFLNETNLTKNSYLYETSTKKLKSDSRYYWRVRASNTDETGEWSDIYEFKIDKIQSVRGENNNDFSILSMSNNNYSIKFKSDIVGLNFDLFDMMGNKIGETKKSNSNEININFDELNISNGVYLLVLNYNNKQNTIILNYSK